MRAWTSTDGRKRLRLVLSLLQLEVGNCSSPLCSSEPANEGTWQPTKAHTWLSIVWMLLFSFLVVVDENILSFFLSANERAAALLLSGFKRRLLRMKIAARQGKEGRGAQSHNLSSLSRLFL